MFTRFRAASGMHVMKAPLISVPDDFRGIDFLGYRSATYEYEEEYVRGWLLRIVKELKANLEQSGLDKKQSISEFLRALDPAIEFLESIPDEFVAMYSWDRAPSIAEILDAYFKAGDGLDDWALEELYKKRDGGRSALLAFLKKEKSQQKLLQAIELLLVVFRDQRTRDAVQRFIAGCGDEIRQEAAKCVAAITAQLDRPGPRQPNRQSCQD